MQYLNYFTHTKSYRTLNFDYKYLPEKESYTVSKFKWNAWFSNALIWGGGAIIVGAFSKDPEAQSGVMIGGAAFIGLLSVIGLFNAFEDEVAYRTLPSNIQQNKITEQEVKLHYDKLYKKWQKDIEEMNANIASERDNIERENNSLSPASVNYK